ncbi:MAG: outer membrane beta-barrel protein [Bacteroidia bacterium]|nr:outer membrane beta-barrel protein [Bacteroidia bacterium]
MSEKQPIDKLFKEKLGEFEATPSASVWDNISQELNQGGGDRKAIPLWMKIVGIAAGIILLISVGNALFNTGSTTTPEQEVVDTEDNTSPDSQESNDILNINESNEPDGNASSDDETEGTIADSETNPEIKEDLREQISTQNKSAVQNNVVENTTGNTTGERAVVGNQSPIGKNKQDKADLNEIPLDSDTKLADKIDEDSKEDGFRINENSKDPKIVNDTDKDPVKKDLTGTANAVAQSEIDATVKGENPKSDQDTVKKDLTDTEKALTEAATDVEETKAEETNDNIEEAIASQEDGDSDEKEEFRNRWGVTPQVAPVYFNSIGSGSAIDDAFAGNSKTGEVNMNYGIVASYDFNEKLTLRAGINQMNVSYRTNDVIVYNNIQPSVDEKPLKNVNLNAESSDLSFISSNGLNVAQVPGVVAANIQSSIDQEIGFIEIPLELEYKLSDNKVGLSLIGGMSTLILSENKIYSSLQGNQTELGEASNINSTSFSANLGVGMNVKLSESIDLNLEPVFKYQLNTFKDTSGEFNPYTLGVYSGLRFKF